MFGQGCIIDLLQKVERETAALSIQLQFGQNKHDLPFRFSVLSSSPSAGQLEDRILNAGKTESDRVKDFRLSNWICVLCW